MFCMAPQLPFGVAVCPGAMASHKVVYKSTGCLPGPSVVKSVPTDDLVRLTYRTAYATGVAGRIPCTEDRGENFAGIHNIGRKESQYMKFQKSTAPLLDYSAVNSRRDFTPHPLGDNKVNAMLAASFKAGWKGSAAGSAAEMPKTSYYQDTFEGYTGSRLRSAKMKSVKPTNARTHTITGMTDLLETRPLSHVSYHSHPQDLAKAGQILLPKPNLGFISKWEGPPEKSSYVSEFGTVKRNHSTPTMSIGELEIGRTNDLLPADHECREYHRVEEAVEEVAPAPEMQPVQTLPAPRAEHVEVLSDALVETSEPRNLEADAQLAQDWLAPAEHPAPVEEFPVESTRQPAAQEQGLEMPVEQSNGHDREVFEGAMPQPPVHANGGPGHVEEPEEPPEEAGPLPDLAANGREPHEVPEEAPPLQFEVQRVEQRSEPGEVGQLRADYEDSSKGSLFICLPMSLGLDSDGSASAASPSPSKGGQGLAEIAGKQLQADEPKSKIDSPVGAFIFRPGSAAGGIDLAGEPAAPILIGLGLDVNSAGNMWGTRPVITASPRFTTDTLSTLEEEDAEGQGLRPLDRRINEALSLNTAHPAEQRLPRQLKPKVRELLRDIHAFQYPRRRNIQHEIREKEIRPPSRQSPIPRTQRTLVEELSLMEPSPVKDGPQHAKTLLARLMGAVQQIAHLQARIEELESEAAVAKDVELQLSEKMGCMTMQLTEAQAARQQAEAASAQLQREADQLRQEASAASERARVQAAEASDAALGQVREEMERELEHLLKQKDEQLRAIESKFAASERSRQNATRPSTKITSTSADRKNQFLLILPLPPKWQNSRRIFLMARDGKGLGQLPDEDTRVKDAWNFYRHGLSAGFTRTDMRRMSRVNFRTGASLPARHAEEFAGSSEEEMVRQGFTSCPEDRPLVVQFCAKSPEAFLEAALQVQERCDAVDLNLGCPQSKAMRGGWGGALMDEENWHIVYAIVRHAASSPSLRADDRKTVRFAKMLQEAGCSLVTVHGRQRDRALHHAPANWQAKAIRAVREALRLPTVANGGVDAPGDAERCFQETGCVAVMVATALLQNPELFLASNALQEHAAGDQCKGEESALRRGVRHCLHYLHICEEYPSWSVRGARDHLRALLAPGCTQQGKLRHADLLEALDSAGTSPRPASALAVEQKDYWQGVCQEFRDVLKLLCVREGLSAADDPNFDEFCWGKAKIENAPRALPEPCRSQLVVEGASKAQQALLRRAPVNRRFAERRRQQAAALQYRPRQRELSAVRLEMVEAREYLRDLEALTHEADALKQELEQLHSDSAGRTSDHERSVEQLTADYQKQIAELEERRDIEERQKHELALNLRSVEERSRSELAQLEAQKTQLELQSGALQVQPTPILCARRVLGFSSHF
ncbi:Dus1l, partial [Symbiodinium sp. KB8]